jgi:hypothetical protein
MEVRDWNAFPLILVLLDNQAITVGAILLFAFCLERFPGATSSKKTFRVSFLREDPLLPKSFKLSRLGFLRG